MRSIPILLTLACIIASGSLGAQPPVLGGVYELRSKGIELPSGKVGLVKVTACEKCVTKVLRITEATTFHLNAEPVPIETFRRELGRVDTVVVLELLPDRVEVKSITLPLPY